MKETRLEEDAYIYKRREEPDEKQKWKNLGKAEKLQYFKDYYLMKILAIVAVTGIGVWILSVVLAPKPETDLYIAMINSSAPTEKDEQSVKKFATLLNSESEESILLDSSYFIRLEDMDQGSLASIQRLSAQAYSKMVDVVIAEEEEFHYFAKQDYFMDMAEALPTNLYSRLSDHIYMDRIETENKDGITYGEEMAYGVCLKDFPEFQAMETGLENPVLGIVVNTEHRKNGIAVLNYLTK